MSLFTKFFKKQDPSSELETFLSRLTLSEAADTVDGIVDAELRSAFAISLAILNLTYTFVTGLRKTQRALGLPVGADHRIVGPAFDAAAFEFSAYCHFWIMRDELAAEWEDDDLEDDVDQQVRQSIHATGSLIERHVNFGLHEAAFFNRSHSYGPVYARDSIEGAIGQLEFRILAAIGDGRPSIGSTPKIPLDLALGLAVKGEVAIAHSTLLRGLDVTVKRIQELS